MIASWVDQQVPAPGKMVRHEEPESSSSDPEDSAAKMGATNKASNAIFMVHQDPTSLRVFASTKSISPPCVRESGRFIT